MLIVALTGGIGSGKSHAGQYFAQLGAIVVDSDQLARDVVERGTPGFEEVLLRFGDEILSNGEIDRKKLGSIVFSNVESREDLEAIKSTTATLSAEIQKIGQSLYNKGDGHENIPPKSN